MEQKREGWATRKILKAITWVIRKIRHPPSSEIHMDGQGVSQTLALCVHRIVFQRNERFLNGT